jgi:hypothetical protein
MEKYGCNRLDEINIRIKELEEVKFKTAEESDDLKELYDIKRDIIREASHIDN